MRSRAPRPPAASGRRGRGRRTSTRPLVSSLPVLVIGGELDPVTPPALWRARSLQTLTHARLLIAPGQGHGVIGVGCMPRLMRAIHRHARSAALDAQCLARLGPTPAFLDYNGAAP